MDSPPGEISVRRTIIGVDKGFGCIRVLSDSVPQPYRLCPGTGGFSHGLRNSPTMTKYMGVDKEFVYMFTGWLQLCFPFIYIRTGCI